MSSYIKEKKQSEYELRKISQGVFDKSTLNSLCDLVNKSVIEELVGIVSTGKESNVYWGWRGGQEIAVKIYCIDASDFRNMERYIIGDHRFSKWKNKRQLIYMWAQKEYSNLLRIQGKVKCPHPYAVEKNILVMSFIGKKGVPAPKLKDLPPLDPPAFFEKTLQGIKNMYKAGVVHGDLSEYNILNHNEEPVFIDISAGVLLDHPGASEFLERDVKNVLAYFRKLRSGTDKKDRDVINWIKKKET